MNDNWDAIEARIYFSKQRDHFKHAYEVYSEKRDRRQHIAHVHKKLADFYDYCVSYSNSKESLISFLKESDTSESEALIKEIESGKFSSE